MFHNVNYISSLSIYMIIYPPKVDPHPSALAPNTRVQHASNTHWVRAVNDFLGMISNRNSKRSTNLWMCITFDPNKFFWHIIYARKALFETVALTTSFLATGAKAPPRMHVDPSMCWVTLHPHSLFKGGVCNRDTKIGEGMSCWFKWERSNYRSRFGLLVQHFGLLQP